MGIFEKLLKIWKRYRQEQAGREALSLLIARNDRHLLRDVGLTLYEDAPRCEPMPQTKERRWKAPLIRLLRPPSPRLRGEGDVAPSVSRNPPAKDGKPVGVFPCPCLPGEGGRQAG